MVECPPCYYTGIIYYNDGCIIFHKTIDFFMFLFDIGNQEKLLIIHVYTSKVLILIYSVPDAAW